MITQAGGQKILVHQFITLKLELNYKGSSPFQGAITPFDPGYTMMKLSHGGHTLFLRLRETRSDAAADSLPNSKGAMFSQGFSAMKSIVVFFDFSSGEYIFKEPGAYSIQMSADLWQGESFKTYDSFRIASNAVSFTVGECPKGERPALRMWDGKGQVGALLSDSYEEANRSFSDGLRELQLLVRRFPKSSYADLARRKISSLNPESERMLFPEDNRLDTRLSIELDDMTSLDAVFRYVSRKTGVPLFLDDALKKRRLKSFPLTTLREFMNVMAVHKAAWVKEGKGYRLVPKVEESR